MNVIRLIECRAKQFLGEETVIKRKEI